MHNSQLDPSILTSEQQFFDREAAALAGEDLRIPPDQIDRYRTAAFGPRNTPKDALFARLLPLDGKRVLDYGCGTGENACLLAACGARVTAFDLSPVSIAVARRRAVEHGLSDTIRFDVLTAGHTNYPAAGFDVVLGFAILHHLHTILPTVLREIAHLLAPGGTAGFIEPVANSPTLRFLRHLVPLKRDATPDERQLSYRDFDPLRRLDFHDIQFAHFYCLERFHRLIGQRRARALRWLDHHAQRALPPLRRLYGTLLVTARAKG